MSNHYQVLVRGGVNAGLSEDSKLLIKKSGLKIGIVDPSEKHFYQPAWTFVGAGIFDIKKSISSQKDLIPKNTTWIKGAVSAFEPNINTVECVPEAEMTYDY